MNDSIIAREGIGVVTGVLNPDALIELLQMKQTLTRPQWEWNLYLCMIIDILIIYMIRIDISLIESAATRGARDYEIERELVRDMMLRQEQGLIASEYADRLPIDLTAVSRELLRIHEPNSPDFFWEDARARSLYEAPTEPWNEID